MSFLKRLSTDAANAYQDLYSNWILGDDAGKSALFTLVLRQQQKQQQSSNEQTVVSSLGMTFVEVNGRAYVYSVTEGSIADEAGIMPQDAVQYATVVRPEWVSISASSAITHDGQTSTVTSNYHDQINNNMTPIDRTTTTDENSLAVKYVLNLERKGARIGYDQLRTLLCKKAMLNETTITTAFLSPPCDCNNNSRQGSMYLCSNNNRYSGNEHSSPSKWNGPPIPSNVCVPIAAENFGNYDEDDITINEKSILYDENGHAYPQQTQQLPVVFVFRRTRQRKSYLQMGVLPSFRLDDECDLASSLVRRLAPSANMDVPPPDTWEELVHDGTDWLLGNGSILPPNLFKAGSGSGGGISSGAIQIESNPDKKKSSMMTRNGSSSSNPNGIPSKYKPSKYDDDDYTSPPDALNVSTTSSVDEDDNDNKNTNYYHCNHTATTCQHDFEEEELSRIPLDEFEKDRAIRVANLQSRMTVEAQRVDRSDDVEAATLRGMIQKAVGLAFVRASKVVLGVSVHGGSGIVIARLPDGTWSAPLAIGTWGIGFGIQFGLEVAEYIFILQTQEALDHFRRGGSYTVGGNMGVAFAGLGREAYGAASVGGVCGGTNTYDVNDTDIYDQYSDNDSRVARQQRQNQSNDGTTSSLNGAIAPIVAYAKSQGLYVGVSLEGSRIFARDDINSRVYKFSTWGRDVTANDILSGKVPTPSEAEGLYAALHCVEFAHEMSCLPRPPDVLLRDYNNPWQFDRSPLGGGPSTGNSINGYPKQKESFAFLSNITAEEKEQCEVFETKFKNFLYGGVSVQRLLVDENDNESLFDKKSPLSQQRNERARRRTRKERRTLWLMLPEVGSLRLGFVSKLSDGENPLSITKNINRKTQLSVSPSTGANHRDTNDRLRFVNDAHNTFSDIATTNSEELTLDSAIQTKDGSTVGGPKRIGNVQLSDTHSVALTDITVVSQEPSVFLRLKKNDKNEHLRVISIQDVAGTTILFLANNFREAELLICGLKLLLERETARLGVRGGLPITALGGRSQEGVMSPAAARGFRETPSKSSSMLLSKERPPNSGSSGVGHWRNNDSKNDDNFGAPNSRDHTRSQMCDESTTSDLDTTVNDLPEGRKKWGTIPSRNYMRGQAEAHVENNGVNELPDNSGITFVHGERIRKRIVKHFRLSSQLHKCRVLLLDAFSAANTRWETDRGDSNFNRSKWTFPPPSTRDQERYSSEKELINSGSMAGANRSVSFDRPRFGSMVRLSELQLVEIDDSRRVTLSIQEQNPRRGFSVIIRVFLRSHRDDKTDVSVYADVRPIGKNMSNQSAIFKAFNLVIEEIGIRYGTENGLLRYLHEETQKIADESSISLLMSEREKRVSRSSEPRIDARTSNPGHLSTNSYVCNENKTQSGLVSLADMLQNGRESPEPVTPDRPSTPSIFAQFPVTNPSVRTTDAMNEKLEALKEPVLVEIKPLPKIRLSLMPPPREEDEYENSSSSGVYANHNATKKKKKSRSSSASKRRSKSTSSSSKRRVMNV